MIADLKCQLLRFNSTAISELAPNVNMKNSVNRNPHHQVFNFNFKKRKEKKKNTVLFYFSFLINNILVNGFQKLHYESKSPQLK